jgi:hypothetical protein
MRDPIDCRKLGPEDAAAFRALRFRGLEECPDGFRVEHMVCVLDGDPWRAQLSR